MINACGLYGRVFIVVTALPEKPHCVCWLSSALTAYMDVFTCANICNTPENVVKVLISCSGYLAVQTFAVDVQNAVFVQFRSRYADFSCCGTTLLLMLEVFIQHRLQGK